MDGPLIRTFSLATRGNPGLTCDDDGLALGPVLLAKAVRDAAGRKHYRLRSPEEMAQALRLAYGPVPDRVTDRWCHGLARVAQLLAASEDAQARIYAVLLGFPEIPPDGMAKLARAANLRKYGETWEDEPRVPAGNPDGGQWTTDGSDVQVASECQGSCQSGGSYGTTAMYRINGKNLCWDCAIKEMKLENQPSNVRGRILNRYIIDGE
jgi:hypothetical protein